MVEPGSTWRGLEGLHRERRFRNTDGRPREGGRQGARGPSPISSAMRCGARLMATSSSKLEAPGIPGAEAGPPEVTTREEAPHAFRDLLLALRGDRHPREAPASVVRSRVVRPRDAGPARSPGHVDRSGLVHSERRAGVRTTREHPLVRARPDRLVPPITAVGGPGNDDVPHVAGQNRARLSLWLARPATRAPLVRGPSLVSTQSSIRRRLSRSHQSVAAWFPCRSIAAGGWPSRRPAQR